MRRLLEIACFSAEAVDIAVSSGAGRIELCSNYAVGGITPHHETIKEVRRITTLPLHVIIRPRESDFVYTANEIAEMKKSILFCREEGIDGIVLGVLTKDGKVDIKAIEELLKERGRMNVTFHRAIDECVDLEEGVGELVKLNVTSVLTSGGKSTAIEGLEVLKKLQHKFGNKITIMPGGGIRSANLSMLISETGCREYHSAAITGSTHLPDEREIKKLLEVLNSK